MLLTSFVGFSLMAGHLCFAALEIRDALYVTSGTMEGYGVTDERLSCSTCSSASQCGSTCVQPSCKGFVVTSGPEACASVSNPSLVSPGTWQTYCKKSYLGNLAWSDNVIPFLRRFDGSVNFNTTWLAYKMGFGDRCQEFWLGMDMIYQLTSGDGYGLRVYMEAFNGDTFWAEYGSFSVMPEADRYRLQVSGFNPASTAGDSIGVHNNEVFTTWDMDTDLPWYYNNAIMMSGGWWYDNGAYSKATGRYMLGGQVSTYGILWTSVYGNSYSFKTMEMALVKK